MRVLAVDTASPVVGVALAGPDGVTLEVARITRGAEAWLHPAAVRLCRAAGIALADLDGVGVAAGPGAFTGLRVGLAMASGVALAAGVPLWSTGSLDHRAARVAGGWRLALLDARKGKVYAQLVDPSDRVIQGPADVLPQVAMGWPTAPFTAVGEGALAYREAVEAAGGTVADAADHPAVDVLAFRARAALLAGEGHAAEQVTPRYLREADAKPGRKGRVVPREPTR